MRRSKLSPKHQIPLTGVEKTFSPDELIVSKTDTRGIITYANDIFLKIAGYKESEVIGMPHNFIRHPAMPHCAFKLLWDRIKTGKEIFAYVVNRTRTGDHYWVLAHVTPSFDAQGQIIGYHSNRRCPSRAAIAKVEPLYRMLSQIEASKSTPREGMEAAHAELIRILEKDNISYDEFVLSL